MRTLPLEFTLHQWTYTQVTRTGDIAIYQQRHNNGTATRFEVVVVQHFAERVIGEHITEAGEYYPGAALWGKAGWTCFTLAEAQGLAAELRVKRMVDG